MKNILSTLLEEFNTKMQSFEGGIKRDIFFPKIEDKIMVAIGMRRVGKTYFLLQNIKEILKTVSISRVLYINFEDDRLLPMNQEKLGQLIDAFYEIFPENHDLECYLFLDEIQNVHNWHEVVRRYFDTKKVKIFLTGSSSKLLSKEIATSLRGRSFAIEIWPFSFCEMERMKNNSVLWDDKKPFGKPSLDKFKNNLNHYLEEGGFPESTFLNTPLRNQLLQEYVNIVIFRDIVERYNINNLSLVKYLIKTMLKNAGGSLSTNKLFNDLKSQGFKVSKMTIYDYLDYIEDAYLAFRVPLYSESLRKVESNHKKIYGIDTGLIKAYSSSLLENKGHYFENLIFLDLKRRGHTIYYYLTEKRYEIDFLSKDLYGKWHMYQICFDVSNPDTYEREVRALESAERELGIKGSIITPDTYFTSFLKNA